MNNIIKINLKKKSDYVSKFNDSALSNELSSYILEECRGYKLKSNILIEVSAEYDIDDSEKDNIVRIVRNNFRAETREVLVSQKVNYIIDFVLLVLGIIGLGIYFLLRDIPVLGEFILIFCWVIIWECIYNLVFITFRNMIDLERKRKLANCKIIFKKN